MKDLQYRTFDELLGEVMTDFHMFNREGFIEPAQLIKVAQRVNYDLGLRITGNKMKVLEVQNGLAKLPDDFNVLNFAMLCSSYQIVQRVPAGRHTEEIAIDALKCKKCSEPEETCYCEKTYAVCDELEVKVVERIKFQTREYKTFLPLRIGPSTQVDPNCPNLRITSPDHAEIKNGFIYTNIPYGKLCISYQGALEDEEGNLLVLDHPLINEYYEYAIKQRILENLYLNGEDVVQRLQLIEQRLRAARNNALTIVNTPDFRELYKLWKTNRNVQYNKYYHPFSSIFC